MKHARAGALVAIAALASFAGCAGHRAAAPSATHPSTEPSSSSASAPAASAHDAATAPAYAPPTQAAFGFDARVLVEDAESRKMKMRFFGQAPDRFRIEVRGPVGGVAFVATGRAGKIRLVIPSRRLYAEGGMEEDLTAGLLGVPISGCDLAMVVRISAGFKKFHPCGEAAPGENDPLVDADQPGLIVDTTAQGEEVIRFGWDWSTGKGEGIFPKEMRVENLAPPQTSLALTHFAKIDRPAKTDDDFYWEPPPKGATLVSIQELGAAEIP